MYGNKRNALRTCIRPQRRKRLWLLSRECAHAEVHQVSENGTNFVGAAKLLQEDLERYKTFQTSEFNDKWPTAGGLWEAAIKAMKYHMKRTLGEQKLTFEQFTTLLTQIEATCMNLSPLCPPSEEYNMHK